MMALYFHSTDDEFNQKYLPKCQTIVAPLMLEKKIREAKEELGADEGASVRCKFPNAKGTQCRSLFQDTMKLLRKQMTRYSDTVEGGLHFMIC